MKFSDRVARGVARLDKYSPDWRDRINRDRLNMAESRDCVLGQLFGSFTEGLRRLDISARCDVVNNAVSLGFDFFIDDNDMDHVALNDAWLAVL